MDTMEDRPPEPCNDSENPEQWARVADWEYQRANRAESIRDDMLEALESIKDLPGKCLAMFEREGFVFDGCGGKWEKLAFTLYSDIVSNAIQAKATIAKAKGEA